MPKPTGETYLGSGDRNHLASERPANAVAQRDAPFHCQRSAQHGAVPHEEIRLHPARAARRNRNGLSMRRLQPRSPITTRSPFGGGGARRTCTASRSITPGKGGGPSAPRSVTVRFVRFRTVMTTAKRRQGMQPISIPSGPDDPSPQRRLPGPADTPSSAVKGRPPAPHPVAAALRARIAPENATAMSVR